MGLVNERTLLTTAPLPPGGDLRPVVLSTGWHQGVRVSRVRRPDGSVFTVSVPRLGMDDHTEHPAARRRWISADSGRPRLSTDGFVRLALAAGLPAFGGPPVGP